MEWNVYISDFNAREIRTHNVFNHWSFRRDVAKIARTRGLTKDDFAERMKSALMYHYWCKCEWEIILQHWPPNERFSDEKIDVYDQIRINYDRFIDYCWEHRKEMKALDSDE